MLIQSHHATWKCWFSVAVKILVFVRSKLSLWRDPIHFGSISAMCMALTSSRIGGCALLTMSDDPYEIYSSYS